MKLRAVLRQIFMKGWEMRMRGEGIEGGGGGGETEGIKQGIRLRPQHNLMPMFKGLFTMIVRIESHFTNRIKKSCES